MIGRICLIADPSVLEDETRVVPRAAAVVCARAARLLLSIGRLSNQQKVVRTALHIVYALSKKDKYDTVFIQEQLLGTSVLFVCMVFHSPSRQL